MTKADLIEFLDSWNQNDKAKDGYKPINKYRLHALMIGLGFCLKWYLPKHDFIAIAKEFDFDLEEEPTDRFFFTYDDQTVEFEIEPAPDPEEE